MISYIGMDVWFTKSLVIHQTFFCFVFSMESVYVAQAGHKCAISFFNMMGLQACTPTPHLASTFSHRSPWNKQHIFAN